MKNNSNETQTGASSYPDDNPKTVLGIKKVPLHLVPPSASHALALGFADGAQKYGPYNWREKTVSASIYVAAAKRHLDAWWDGEEVAKDSGVPHLAHAMACLAIIYDGLTVGKLNDDRPPKGASPRLQEEYASKEKDGKQRITDAGDLGLRRADDNPLPATGWESIPYHELRDRVKRADARRRDSMEVPRHPVEYGRVSDLQADLQSGYATKFLYGDGSVEFWYTNDGGVERYDSTGSRLMPGPAEGRVHS